MCNAKAFRLRESVRNMKILKVILYLNGGGWASQAAVCGSDAALVLH